MAQRATTMTQISFRREASSRRFEPGRRRGPRVAGLLVVLALLAPPGLRAESLPTGDETAVKVAAVGKRLNPEDWAQDKVGPLTWRGGLELTSPAPYFGGFSGLLLSTDGRHLTAVNDQGHWLTAEMTYDAAGDLSGLTGAAMGPLLGEDGAPLDGKGRQDAESLARLANGDLLVAFERDHRLWRYAAVATPAGQSPLAQRPNLVSPPEGSLSLPANQGLEAMVALPGGRIFAIAEGETEKDLHPAFIWDGQTWRHFSYRGADGHRPTGATLLPDGDILLLERRFTTLGGLSLRLARLAASALQDPAGLTGKTLSGQELVRLSPPLTIDNFEGIAARQGAKGETLIALLSDDNFSPLQRTLLLLFELRD